MKKLLLASAVSFLIPLKAFSWFNLNGLEYDDYGRWEEDPEITYPQNQDITRLVIYEDDEHSLFFIKQNLKITGNFKGNGVSSITFGQTGQTSNFNFSDANLSKNYSKLIFLGTTVFTINATYNNSTLFYTGNGASDAVTGTVYVVVQNGSIPVGNSLIVYASGNIIQSNSLYNYTISPTQYQGNQYTISPKTSAQIQTAGFTQGQADRLVEIMQTQHGADPTNDEIVRLAQMGDIEGAKRLLGGDAPVMPMRLVYIGANASQVRSGQGESNE